MDKAKEKALETYPGRKDSAVTTEDISKIKDLLDIVRAVKGVSIPQDQFYEEVLKRYNNWKENKSKN